MKRLFSHKPSPPLFTTVALALVLLLCGPTRAWSTDLKRDTLFLNNGEILIGEIQGMKLGVVTIDSKDVGLLYIKISKISAIDSAQDTLRIETKTTHIYYGALKPSGQKGKVFIITESGKHLVDLMDINEMLSLHKRFADKLRSSVSAGFSFSHSSGIGQLTLNGSISYTAKVFDLGINASSMASIDTSIFSRDREEVKVSSSYNLRRKLYLIGAFDYQRNLQLSIARRFQQTIGPGWKFIPGSSTQLVFFSGISVNQELSTSGEQQNFLFEIPMGLQFNFFKFSHPNLQFTTSNSFYVSLSQWGRIRYDINNTLSWEIINNLSISLNIYLNYDRRPPDNSNKGKIDYGTVLSFSYKL